MELGNDEIYAFNSIIDPNRFEVIDYGYFLINFEKIINSLKSDSGVIYIIKNHPHLKTFYEKEIKPKLDNKNKIVNYNKAVSEIINNQSIQKALFTDIKDKDIWIDSFVRIRNTFKDEGAWINEHRDVAYGASINAINFWTTFTNLQKDETLYFLKKKYAQPFIDHGQFTPGCYLDKHYRLWGKDEMLKDAIQAELEKFDILLFNSGRMMHFSPQKIHNFRLTIDQRIIINPDFAELNMGEIGKHYRVKDIEKFNGQKSYNDTLREIHSFYSSENLPTSFFKMQSLTSTSERHSLFYSTYQMLSAELIINILNNFKDIEISSSLSHYFVSKFKNSPGQLSAFLCILQSRDLHKEHRKEIAGLILNMPVISPVKFYKNCFIELGFNLRQPAIINCLFIFTFFFKKFFYSRGMGRITQIVYRYYLSKRFPYIFQRT